MAIKREQRDKPDILATVINTATSETSYIRNPIKQDSIIFDKGTGQSLWNNPGYGVTYGEWMIVPNDNFITEVKMWGAGGGAHGGGGTGGAAGGGGHTYGTVQFLKGIPYVVWVGESGFYQNYSYDSNANRHCFRSGTTFGGGGGGGHNGGGGGGLSGLFFECAATGGGPAHGINAVSTTFRSPGQSTSLLIAGGGGGEGHHSGSNHGGAGGGGGETANAGHATAPATQHSGGHKWDTHYPGNMGTQFQGGHGGANSYTGGGGGGWYGGTGGTYYPGHHNGGSGGSGHLLPNTISEYPNYWIKEKYPNLVSNAGSVVAPAVHGTYNPAAAGISDIDYVGYTGYGGGNLDTYTPNRSSGNNGRVMIRFKKGMSL
jgi:hypothetical protein